MIERLPEEFLERLKNIVGVSVFRDLEKAFVERPTSFRVNTLKVREYVGKQVIEELGFKLKAIPWYRDAFILQNKSKRELTELDIYKTGGIYIQSLASMVPPLVLDPKPGETVLDLTAAPGSKTSQIAALIERQGELIANDNNKVRFFKLKHNMELLGVTEERAGWTFRLRMEDGSHLCGEYGPRFDKILLDAPCSAEARFVAGDPKTFGYWSERKIKEMAFKQRKLLFSAWHALKPGGMLVYSTCTFAPEENEVQVSRLLERYPDEAALLPIDIPGLKTLPSVKTWREKVLHKDIQKTIRLCPTQDIEGFFVAKITKKGV